MPAPLFITFEGIDGSGKSTQAGLLLRQLQAEDHRATLVREPGSTPLGEHLRTFLKGNAPLNPTAELLLFEAARAELVNAVITPALQNGTTVIADRHTDSSVAYQGGGRGLDLDTVRRLNTIATGKLTPDVTFLITVAPETAVHRSGDNTARFENTPQSDPTFYNRVAKAYSAQADMERDRIHVLDGALSRETLFQQIWNTVANKLRHNES